MGNILRAKNKQLCQLGRSAGQIPPIWLPCWFLEQLDLCNVSANLP